MRTAVFAFAALVAALLIWTAGASAKTNAPKPASSANPVTYGKSVQITGALKGNPSANMPIALQQNPFPYAGYTTLLSANTSATGAYAFSVAPRVNTRYRVVTTTATPQVISAELAQTVNQRVSFSVSDKTPRKGAQVRFYGTVTPARDGSYVSLQKRSSTGSYNTVGRIKLVDAGDVRSSYSKRIRIYKSAAYRVVAPATSSLGAGTSAKRTLTVH
ncbi:MAG: hypothetical protein JHC98_09945 [Thermoleophilaceae bacterium]|nr:hypothetical protein [Thermoleophilaceae bacterium]